MTPHDEFDRVWNWTTSIAIIFMILTAMGFSGCTGTNVAEWTKALAAYRTAEGQDPRSLCLKLSLSTPWGTQNTQLALTGLPNGDVSCNTDGLTVRSQPPSIPVGITVTPTSQK